MNKAPFSPKTHIFLWDLHDVILQKSLWKWFIVCLQFDRKKELLRNLNKKSLKIVTTFILERLKITKKQMVSEELIRAAREVNNDALVELTKQACSSYAPIKQTVHLINELSGLGFTHHLGSNIGKTVFDDCVKKFPTIFSHFKESTIPFETDSSKFIKKPHVDFFYAHMNKHNLHAEQIIFIDDKLSNVLAAQSVGIHAIQFKNAEQLRKELIEHKILLS